MINHKGTRMVKDGEDYLDKLERFRPNVSRCSFKAEGGRGRVNMNMS